LKELHFQAEESCFDHKEVHAQLNLFSLASKKSGDKNLNITLRHSIDDLRRDKIGISSEQKRIFPEIRFSTLLRSVFVH
jgi:hypothetical protein